MKITINQTSKFRNIHAEPWMQNTFIKNVRPNPNCDPVLQVSSSLYAVAWRSSGDGLLYYGLNNRVDVVAKPKYSYAG